MPSMQMMDLAEARKILELSLAEYSTLRGDYWANVYDAVDKFLRGDRNLRGFFNDMRIAITESYKAVADQAWQDGGKVLPIDESTSKFIEAAIRAEFSHADQLAERFIILKKEDGYDPQIEAPHEAIGRADGYASSLDKIYAEVKTRAAGNLMLTFGGQDGAESCADCQRYKGKRHRASWWVSHNAVPPNRDFECKGYRCEHVLIDDRGNLFTI